MEIENIFIGILCVICIVFIYQIGYWHGAMDTHKKLSEKED